MVEKNAPFTQMHLIKENTYTHAHIKKQYTTECGKQYTTETARKYQTIFNE